jgi:hypothetical protein
VATQYEMQNMWDREEEGGAAVDYARRSITDKAWMCNNISYSAILGEGTGPGHKGDDRLMILLVVFRHFPCVRT